MATATESTRIETTLMSRIRKHLETATPKVAIGSFITFEMNKVMDRLEARKLKSK